jgi:hypothetical protein
MKRHFSIEKSISRNPSVTRGNWLRNPDINRIQNERSSTTAILPLLNKLIHEKPYATRARLIVDEWQNTRPHNERFAKPQ